MKSRPTRVNLTRQGSWQLYPIGEHLDAEQKAPDVPKGGQHEHSNWSGTEALHETMTAISPQRAQLSAVSLPPFRWRYTVGPLESAAEGGL